MEKDDILERFDLGVDFGGQEQEDPLNGSRQPVYGEDELQVYQIISTAKGGNSLFNGES